MKDLQQVLYGAGIIPVIKIDDAEKAVPLANALKNGGLNVLEVTFRTDCAAQAIAEIKNSVEGVTVIAGTVLSVEKAKQALEAGAEAIVAPGLNPELVKFCTDSGVPVCPGVSTASEIEQAMNLGLNLVKFFPAEAVGGLKAIKALSAPYAAVKFMPTGGINENNVCDYLGSDKICACGGSWMVSEKLVHEGKFDEIQKLTEQAVRRMLGLSIAHVGINVDNKSQPHDVAADIGALTGLPQIEGNSSVFVGDAVEVMKGKGMGEKGHIALYVNNIERAVAYFSAKKILFDEKTAKYDANAKLTAIYFKREIGGFAFHLVQKKA